MMARFTQERSDAIRSNLINHVAEISPSRRRRVLWATSFVLTGALAGAGVSAGAFAATGSAGPFSTSPSAPSPQPSPSYPGVISAPPGVIPGAPVVSLLGEPRSQPFDSPVEVSLENRSSAATHARVTITAITNGSLTWGTDPEGNNPSASWTSDDVAAGPNSNTWFDFPLDSSVETLYLKPSALQGIVTVQYITYVPTSLGVNAKGQTFGIADSIQGQPDLVSVVGSTADGAPVEGYVFATALSAVSPDHEGTPSDPAEGLRWQAEAKEKYPNGWTIPVFLSDGETQVGTLLVGR